MVKGTVPVPAACTDLRSICARRSGKHAVILLGDRLRNNNAFYPGSASGADGARNKKGRQPPAFLESVCLP
jgi:hypothetical protein